MVTSSSFASVRSPCMYVCVALGFFCCCSPHNVLVDKNCFQRKRCILKAPQDLEALSTGCRRQTDSEGAVLYLLAPAKKRKSSPSEEGGGGSGNAEEQKLRTVGLVKVKTNKFVLQWHAVFLVCVCVCLNCEAMKGSFCLSIHFAGSYVYRRRMRESIKSVFIRVRVVLHCTEDGLRKHYRPLSVNHTRFAHSKRVFVFVGGVTALFLYE